MARASSRQARDYMSRNTICGDGDDLEAMRVNRRREGNGRYNGEKANDTGKAKKRLMTRRQESRRGRFNDDGKSASGYALCV